MRFVLFISRRHFRQSTPLVSALTKMAFAVSILSVAIPIWLISVVSGMHKDTEEKIIAIHGHLRLESIDPGFTNYEETSAYITKKYSEYISISYPYFHSTGLVQSKRLKDDQFTAVTIRAFKNSDIVKNKFVQKQFRNIHSSPKGLFTLPEKGSIFLSRNLALSLGVFRGDILETFIPIGNMSSQQRFQKVPVAGQFSGDFAEIDKNTILMALETLPETFHAANISSGIGIIIKPSADPYELGARFERDEHLRSRFYIANTLNEGILKDFQWQKRWIRILMALMSGVAFLTVFITLKIAVFTRYKEIGILRAIGSSIDNVRLIFIYEGLIIGVIGAILGSSLGLILSEHMNNIIEIIEWSCRLVSCGDPNALPVECSQCIFLDENVFYETNIQAHISYEDILIQAYGVILASTAAAAFPAHHAAHIPPAKIFQRHQ